MLASGLLLVALLACLTVMALLSVWRQRKIWGKLPPGPTPLPFLGNYLQLNTEQMYNSLMKVAQGVAFSNGERAKQLRRFSITTLRDFGVGKRGIEERIQEEAGFLIEAFRATRGALVDPTFFLSQAFCNVISTVAFGDRFHYENKELLSLLGMMKGSLEFTATSAGQEKKNPNTEFYMKNLVLTTLNLFFAGTETVSTTLRYGFLLLMKHPDVEAKVHEEIDRVIGKNRQPKFEDRAKMPYTEAVIHEIQRFGDMIPMGLARRVTKDTKFRDFFLPKGTEVFPMLGSVLRDPKFFSNPRDFNPQHFLDEKGQFKKSDAFVPFSIGKRYCFGEGLARMELFLFLTTILQNFRFQSPQSPEDIDVSPKHVGFATIPRNYTMSFLPR
uniref:Cytochrome P450 family 2 subfamily A member 13, pseudo n=1 Tax=Microcebus murinus TaxID=30608 RepID=A0A8C5VA03_MICMU